MGLIYHDRQRKNARVRSVTLAGSATVTGSANGAAVEVGDATTLRLNLIVTAHAGTTPTLDVKVQTCPTSGGTWVETTVLGATTGAFPQVTTVNGTTRVVVTGLDRFVRIVSTLGGTTPSYTYSVSGEAV